MKETKSLAGIEPTEVSDKWFEISDLDLSATLPSLFHIMVLYDLFKMYSYNYVFHKFYANIWNPIIKHIT
jgi:hypothetical protein